jgi:membrane protein implicated in regulation of membrane protease activity
VEPTRFPGGVSTAIRLALLSIVVGVVLSALNIRPQDLILHLRRFVDFIYSMGFGAVEWAFQYLLLGAVVVVPIWLISRLFSGLSSRRDDRR